jgi:Calx-beta domain/FG-GAP-like repeat
VAVGDFNGDGKLDLGVTANFYTPGHYGPGYWGYWGGYYPGPWYSGYYTGSANVLLGNGDGSFSGPNTTWLGTGYHTSAAVANFNGDTIDGHPVQDFVTINSDYGAVSVLLGDSSGYLQGPNDFYTGYSAFSVAAGDLDADGHTDLVTANFYGNNVSVLLGDGAGGFSGGGTYATGGYAASVVLGDFTHDGHLDVATANGYSNGVSVLYGGGDGTLSTAVTVPAGTYPWAVAAGDFNGDGWLDAATANNGGGDVSVLTNDHSWPTPPPPPPPSVSINDPAAVTEGNTGSVNVTFTLTLSFAYGQPITVHYQTADNSAAAGSDYTAASGDVVFAAGETTKMITVAVLGDRLAEPTESFVVNLTTTEAFIGDDQGVGTILDDEPRVSLGDVTVTEGNTGSVSARFRLTLSAASDAAVTVHYDTANGSALAGSDYTGASGNVTIPAGQTGIDLLIAVTGDRLAEPTEQFFVNLSTPTNAGISDGQGVGTILDNEPRLSINSVAKKEGNGNTTAFVFTVTLSVAYDQAVTVNYATQDYTAIAGVNYMATSGTLTFAPGETSKTITVAIIQNYNPVSTTEFLVNLSGASANALIVGGQGSGTIFGPPEPIYGDPYGP